MTTKSLITAERLREVMDYDPATGVFTWKINNRGKTRAGDIAGSTRRDGYVHVTIAQKTYLAHRLAWLYVTGNWPAKQIDHINVNPTDNRFYNLREATQTQNNGNSKRSQANKSGHKGVRWNEKVKKWHAFMKRNNRYMHIGLFDEIEIAVEAYAKAAREYFGEFARPHG